MTGYDFSYIQLTFEVRINYFSKLSETCRQTVKDYFG